MPYQYLLALIEAIRRAVRKAGIGKPKNAQVIRFQKKVLSLVYLSDFLIIIIL